MRAKSLGLGGGSKGWVDEGEEPDEIPTGPWDEDLRRIVGFLKDADDDYDSTYANFLYEVPDAIKVLE